VWSFDDATAAVPGDRNAHVVAVRDRFLLRFTLTGESKADIEELQDIMKSLHFD
jgi:hypothetical protein